MEQYISKSAVVEEIKRRKKEAELNCGGYKSYDEHRCDSCTVGFYEEFLEILDTLEVKEVDLEKEIKSFTMSKELYEADSAIKAVAEHFFELGLNSQTKDMQEALHMEYEKGRADVLRDIDPYEQCVQYDSIKAGIQTHAETYSFNIESMLFNQLTKEQQELWRKEIEQACISGGEVGVELARDPRYKENLEAKEVREETVNEDLEEAAEEYAPDFSNSIASKAAVDAIRDAFKAGTQWQALHSLETIKGMEEQAFLAGVEAEQTYKSFSKEELEELLNKWRKIYETE